MDETRLREIEMLVDDKPHKHNLGEMQSRIIQELISALREAQDELDYAKSAPTYYADYVSKLQAVREAAEAYLAYHLNPDATGSSYPLEKALRRALDACKEKP